MNYNRRSTRPDGLFYREQRKLRGGARGRGAQAARPLAIVAIVALLAILSWWLKH